MTEWLFRERAVACLLAACLAAGGCSSARYDADYSRAVAEWRTRAEFSRLRERPAELAGGRVRLRPPSILADSLSDNGPDPRFSADEAAAPKTIDPRRIRPPFLESLPGWAGAYEGLFGPPNGRLPATLSIAVVPKADMSAATIEKRLLDLVRNEETLEAAQAAWQDREVNDQAGTARRWRVLGVHGRQRIDRFVGDVSSKEPQYEPIAATVEIWLSTDGDAESCTMLVWRVPDEISADVKLEEYAPLVARSVEIVTADAAAAAAERPATGG